MMQKRPDSGKAEPLSRGQGMGSRAQVESQPWVEPL